MLPKLRRIFRPLLKTIQSNWKRSFTVAPSYVEPTSSYNTEMAPSTWTIPSIPAARLSIPLRITIESWSPTPSGTSRQVRKSLKTTLTILHIKRIGLPSSCVKLILQESNLKTTSRASIKISCDGSLYSTKRYQIINIIYWHQMCFYETLMYSKALLIQQIIFL